LDLVKCGKILWSWLLLLPFAKGYSAHTLIFVDAWDKIIHSWNEILFLLLGTGTNLKLQGRNVVQG
jgi:hypothetical protein